MRINVDCDSQESWEVFVNGHFVCRGYLGGFQTTEDLRQEIEDVAPTKNALRAIKKIVDNQNGPMDEKARLKVAQAFIDGLHNVTQSFNVDIHGAKPTVIPGRPGDKIEHALYDHGWNLGRCVAVCSETSKTWPNRWNHYWNAETAGFVSHSDTVQKDGADAVKCAMEAMVERLAGKMVEKMGRHLVEAPAPTDNSLADAVERVLGLADGDGCTQHGLYDQRALEAVRGLLDKLRGDVAGGNLETK
jgi:hypothetical protein